MRRLLFIMTLDGKYDVQSASDDATDAVLISFSSGWQVIGRDRLQFREGVLEQNGIDWIWNRGRDWFVNFDSLRKQFEDFFAAVEWLQGTELVVPELVEYPDFITSNRGTGRSLEFRIYREEFVIDRNRKVFLSHKGADKPLVRDFFNVLTMLRFDPWLDEDAMVAGTELERGILKGFELSCAAVFFVTPQFADENYLATEVNYAIAEKRKKGNRFSIITIVFRNGDKKGTVPGLLTPYVWKEPASRLEALGEIIRALPLEATEPRWKADLGHNGT